MPTRKANATWQGGIKGGNGSFAGESGKLGGAYSFGSRFADEGGTNPEEMLAAANAACFSMALSGNLERNGTPPTQISTDAACTIEKSGDGFKITTMKLTVRAKVPNVDEKKFHELAEKTKTGCPVSQALSALDIQMDATLEK